MFNKWLLIVIFYFPVEVMAINWLQNQEQQGQTAFEQGHYGEAVQLFSDPYRRGVALYRDKKYAEAAKTFATVTRPETKVNALYNLGNAYFQQNDYERAMASYQQALAMKPDFEDARYNMELAKKQLNAPQQNSSQSDHSGKNQKDEQNTHSAQQGNPENSPSPQQESEKESKENQASSENNSELSKDSSENHQDLSKSPEKNESAQTNDSPNQPAQSAEKLPEIQAGQQGNQTDTMDNPSPSASAEQPHSPPNEKDKMVDALLNRLQENPQQLLQRQFRIDAYHAKQANVPFPDKTW
ncbi:MAG: hypothetical protein BWK79_03180 [Beggiatoa sp. IS2]|nr:MAG: hypothetical protein BWK79_03180 [Beggiatoa sp. IS2]